MEACIFITERDLERIGDHWIMGAISRMYPNHPLDKLSKVVITIPETTNDFREKNGGPKQYIVNEYTIGCLMREIVSLMSQGIKVEILSPQTLTE